MLLGMVAMPPSLWGLTIRTSLIPDSIQLGQNAIWRVTISAPSSEPIPKVSPPTITGLEFQSQSEDTTYIPNGKRLIASRTQQFMVTPRTAGVFTFPAIQLTHQGKPMRSNQLVLLVTAPPDAKPGLPKSAIELTSHVSTQKVYVGQPIQYRLIARLAPGITDEALLDDHTLTPPLMAGFLELIPPPSAHPIQNTQNRSKTLLSRVLIPMTPGLHTLSEATLVTRFTKQAVTQLSLSDPIDIEVLAIPNPPPDFKGAVGTLKLQINTTTLRGRPRQAIPIWVTLRGEGNAMMINELIPPTANGVHIVHRLTKPSATQWQETRYLYDITPHHAGTFQLPAFQLMVFSPSSRSFNTVSSPPLTLFINEADMPVLPYPPDFDGLIDHTPYDGRRLMVGLGLGSLLLIVASELLVRIRRSPRPPASNWPHVHRKARQTLATLSNATPSSEAGYQLYQLGITVLSERMQQPLTALSHDQRIGAVLAKGGDPEWVALLTDWGDCIDALVYNPDGISAERYQQAITLTRQLIKKTTQWRPLA